MKKLRRLFVFLMVLVLALSSTALALEPGEVPVYLHIPAEKITLLCPRENWCNGGDACLKRLSDELGPENVVLK